MKQYASRADNMTYDIQKKAKRQDVAVRHPAGPPSSAPIFGLNLRNIIMPMVIKAKTQNTHTEKPREPGMTSKAPPFASWKMAANDHAIPIPR